MKITKRKLIGILRKEPLFPGRFLYFPGDRAPKLRREAKKCEACAVGRIIVTGADEIEIKRVLKDITRFDAACQDRYIVFGDGYYKTQALQEVRHKNYLGAISIMFEGECKKHMGAYDDSKRKPAGKRVVNNLISFVKEYLPNEIKVRI